MTTRHPRDSGQTGHAGGQHANVQAAGIDDVERLAAYRGNRAGHIFNIFAAALSGHRYRFQFADFRSRLSNLTGLSGRGLLGKYLRAWQASRQ